MEAIKAYDLVEKVHPYRILIPVWFSGETRVHIVSPLRYYFSRVQFWRYRLNTHHGFLVQINRMTRPKHFEEDWERPSTFGDAFGKLREIAKV